MISRRLESLSTETYLSEGPQNVVLIVLIRAIAHAHQAIEAAEGHEGVHQILILLEHLLQREEGPPQVAALRGEEFLW